MTDATSVPDPLVQLREALHDRIAAELAARHPRPARARRRVQLVAAAAALLLVGGVVALLTRDEPDQRGQVVVDGPAGPGPTPVPGPAGTSTEWATEVADNLPRSAALFIGTEPTCTGIGSQTVWCRLARSPAQEHDSDFRGRTETLVDDDSTVVGGCRSEDAAGQTWTCYLGQPAVDQGIIAPDLLGQQQPVPGIG